MSEASLHGGQVVQGLLALLGFGSLGLRVAHKGTVEVVADLLKLLPHVLHSLDVTEKGFNTSKLHHQVSEK